MAGSSTEHTAYGSVLLFKEEVTCTLTVRYKLDITVDRSHVYLQEAQTKNKGKQRAGCFFFFGLLTGRVGWIHGPVCNAASVPLSILNTKAPLFLFSAEIYR